MASKTVDMGELSVLVRSIIMSEKGGMEKSKFLTQFKSQEGSDFPFKVNEVGVFETCYLVNVYSLGTWLLSAKVFRVKNLIVLRIFIAFFMLISLSRHSINLPLIANQPSHTNRHPTITHKSSSTATENGLRVRVRTTERDV